MMKKSCKCLAFIFLVNVILVKSCPENWFELGYNSGKCVRYFNNKLNFTEAEYICRDIYDGDLVAIESAEEQRALVQYLFGLLGFQKGPLTWIGAKVEPPNNLVMVNKASPKYSNFDVSLTEISLTEAKCVKILSLVPKGDGGVHGLWSIDGCHYADSGFVCQRKSGSKLAEMANDEPKASEDKPMTPNFLLEQFKEQLLTIKDVCESQMKAIERLSNNFLYVIQHYQKDKSN